MSRIVTFYSYKGGVGRSMALANVAVVLSQWGYKVLIVDFDLEAPGLQYFFKNHISNFEEKAKSDGIINYLNDSIVNKDNNDSWKKLIISISISYRVGSNNSRDFSEAQIDLITSGNKNSENYIDDLRQFNASSFYKHHDGSHVIEYLRNAWLRDYDFVLIDSRTGVTDIGGICTIQLPDLLVILFTTTEQGWEGTKEVASKVIKNHNALPFDRDRLKILPIPSRIDNSEKSLTDDWFDKIAIEIGPILSNWIHKSVSIRPFVEKVSIPYVPFYSYGEKISVIDDFSNPLSMGYSMVSITSLIANEFRNNNLFYDSRDEYVRNVSGKKLMVEKAKANQSNSKLYEAKILIIGDGGSGKTSLARKLLSKDNPLPSEFDTTKGLEVTHYNFITDEGNDFRANIWDFGGQEIYHATHQFFLTKRSLYILLDDTRIAEKTVNDPSFNYWLQMAQIYGGGSPLLIVQNEKGDRSKQIDLKEMQSRFEFVKDSKATNLLTCRGIDEVWNSIEFWLKQLPHIGEELPKSWIDIRNELEQITLEGRDYIHLDEYYDICAAHNIIERKQAFFLSSYLHDLGVFLHFQDHPLLRKMLVLNNQWVTDGVYRVLDCEDVKQKFGRFNRQDLARIWADDRYTDQHDELLALMEKFELCYKLPDEKVETWLAPQLLSVLQPDALVWDDSDNLQVRYEYEFMPKGLLSQHIVRMHRYIKQTELAWKSGVVFERAGAQALVTEAWGSRNIRIRARGVHAKELLTLLSEDFDKMHERLEGLKVRKMIPCNCPKCAKTAEPHFYDYEKLLRRKLDGKRTVECDLSYEDVSVAGLLDGIFAKNISNNIKKLFISYSKSDKAYLEDFKKQLSPYRRQNLLETWDDSKIGAGEEWDKAIKRELTAADIIVLLISADLINTDYIWDVEMKEAMERHERGEATVIPVIIRSCAWEKAPFGKLNALPEKGVPVEKWSNKDEAWTQVVKRIEQVL